MADKRSIRRDIKKLQRVKTWQLLILLILAGFLSATFLRLNNTGMVQRRNAVTAADKVGGAQQIAERIAELQRYSTAHMNASSGVIYLQHQYDRDAQAAIKAVSNTSSEGATANARAEAVCHPQIPPHGIPQTFFLGSYIYYFPTAAPSAQDCFSPRGYRRNPHWRNSHHR